MFAAVGSAPPPEGRARDTARITAASAAPPLTRRRQEGRGGITRRAHAAHAPNNRRPLPQEDARDRKMRVATPGVRRATRGRAHAAAPRGTRRSVPWTPMVQQRRAQGL
eukprot:gene21904-64129_t